MNDFIKIEDIYDQKEFALFSFEYIDSQEVDKIINSITIQETDLNKLIDLF